MRVERLPVRGSAGAGRKLMAGTAVAMFVLAQPRMFCAVHCMLVRDADSPSPTATSTSGRNASADGTPRAIATDPCAQVGTIITSAPVIPVEAVSPATLASVVLPVFTEARPATLGGPALWVPLSATPSVDPPPPRT